MSRSRTARLLGVAFLAACLGACAVPVPPEPAPPADEPEQPPPQVPAEDLKALAEGNNAFAIDLYKKLAKKDGNIVVSPYSIRTALGMTYAGARGQTAEEMRKVLHLTLPDEKLHPAFGATAYQLKGGKDAPYKLNIANALWGQKGFPFRPEFLDLTKKNYAGGFRELDFARDADAARQTINRWVEEKTQDKIKELLKEGDIHRNVRLVLTNAIYFKGTWAQPFKAEWTKDEDFETAPGAKVKVPVMSVAGRFRYHAGKDFELVELPYQGERLSMVVLLPKERCGLAAVEKTLTADALREGIAKLRNHDGRLSLPKFKTNSRFKLRDPLKELGMPLAFSAADFSGINPGGGLSIQQVIHGGDIEVDERGTEAAAATAVIMGRSAAPEFAFRADHPFLYLLMDRTTGTLLFVGRLTTP
jgi:serpin B